MAMQQAYATAALMRSKRLPDPDRLMRRRLPEPRTQSREMLQAMCDALAAAWGAKKE
jgi:hypothetical protein